MENKISLILVDRRSNKQAGVTLAHDTGHADRVMVKVTKNISAEATRAMITHYFGAPKVDDYTLLKGTQYRRVSLSMAELPDGLKHMGASILAAAAAEEKKAAEIAAKAEQAYSDEGFEFDESAEVDLSAIIGTDETDETDEE